jgi:hypothetical protein
VFVLVHQPPFSVGGHCGAALAEADWVGLFERHRVSAVFAGHDHAYERMERGGVRYFVSGGGGAPVYPERPDCATYDRAARRVYAGRHHYLRVRVIDDAVEVTAVPVGGPPGEPPLDVVRFDRRPMLASTAPPLVAEISPVRPALLALGILALVTLSGRVVRRRSEGAHKKQRAA